MHYRGLPEHSADLVLRPIDVGSVDERGERVHLLPDPPAPWPRPAKGRRSGELDLSEAPCGGPTALVVAGVLRDRAANARVLGAFRQEGGGEAVIARRDSYKDFLCF